MYYGKYFFFADNDELMPIEWVALAESKDAILYLTKNCIDMKLYSVDKPGRREWSGSTIRKWLNSDFFSMAFTEAERRLILPVEHENDGGEGVFLRSATVTDSLFLLSSAEVVQYLSDSSIRKTELTPYAANKKEYSDDPWWWWTRTSGNIEYDGALVHYAGVACAIPDDENMFPFPNAQEIEILDEVNAIRPAFWMRKEL